MGLGLAIVGILIALFGFIDALSSMPGTELQALKYILAALGILIVAVGAVLRRLEKHPSA